MKKVLLIGICLCSFLLSKGQSVSYEYDYDNAGNRIRSVVVRLDNRSGGETNFEKHPSPLTDMMADGLTMTLYPNPTQGTILFELSGNKRVGDYVLSDITGRIVEKGCCGHTSLTLDLSNQNDGVYILELFIEKKPRIYKIVKQ